MKKNNLKHYFNRRTLSFLILCMGGIGLDIAPQIGVSKTVFFALPTTGVVTMALIFLLYYTLFTDKESIIRNINILIVLLVTVIPYVNQFYSEKVDNTSGMVRYGDWRTAIAVVVADYSSKVTNLIEQNIF